MADRKPVLGVDFFLRPGTFRRRSDGRIVVAADWTDGYVSWRFEPIPVASFVPVVGTVSSAKFARDFEEIPA